MSKTLRPMIFSLFAVCAIGSFACRHPAKPTHPAVVPEPVAPTLTIPVPVPVPAPTAVPAPTDFVNESRINQEQLPSNLDELNRLVQQRGDIRDAFFAYDEATLSADAQAALTSSATWLRKHPEYSLLIEGHCDERGTERYNLALGDRRANTAREYVMTLGMDGSRIKTVSYGQERPFETGHNEEAWAKNRRAHLVLVR